MGKITLLQGPSHSNITNPLLDRACQRLQAGQGESFLLVLPGRPQVDQARQHLLQAGTGPLLMAPFLFDPESLLQHLLPLGQRALLPPGAGRALTEDVLKGTGPAGAYFRPTEQAPFSGLAQNLSRLLEEWRQVGIDPKKVGLRLEKMDMPQRKRRALEAAYHGYQQRLEPHWIDRPGLLHSLAANFDAVAWADRFAGVDLLLVAHYQGYQPALQQLCLRLADLLPESVIALAGDTPPELAKGNFTIQAIAPASTTTPVYIHQGTDRLDEVQAMAATICHLQQSTGATWEQFLVGFRQGQTYLPLVAEVFPRYGLPVQVLGGRPLASAPVAAAVMTVIDAVLENYARPALLRILSSPYLQLSFAGPQGPQTLAAADLDTWARPLSRLNGRRAWLAALDQRRQQLDRDLAQLDEGQWLGDEDENPEKRLDWARQERDQLDRLQQGLQALFDCLAPLEKRLPLATFARRLRTALDQLDLAAGLLPDHWPEWGPQRVAADARALARFYRLLDELATPGLRQQRFTPREATDLLRAGLHQARYQVPGESGVMVAELQACADLPCPYVLVGGLVEGEFPRLPPADIFLDEGQRRALGLASSDDYLTRDRHLFDQTAALADQALYLFHPSHDGGQPLAPSSFLQSLPATKAPDLPAGQTTRAAQHIHLGDLLAGPADAPQAQDAVDCVRQAGPRPDLVRLVRGLDLAQARSRTDHLGPYDGVLDQADIRQALGRRYGAHHPFSITQLESYARCPFLFFADRVLGIAPLPDPEEDREPMERGNLLHRILYRFYTERQDQGAPTAAERPQALQQIRRLAREEAQDMGLAGFFWERELERLVGTDEPGTRQGLLDRFLQLEGEEKTHTQPTFFELGFGSYPDSGPQDPHSPLLPLELIDPETDTAVRIWGKIDRIDRAPNGQFVVLDYKSGGVPTGLADIRAGTSLQLPVYLLAAEKLLGDQGLTTGVAGAYYQLRDLENCGKKGLFADKSYRGQIYQTRARTVEHEEFRAALDQAQTYILRYVRALRQGRFHPTRQAPEKTCTYCNFRQTCRIDPPRMRALSIS